MNKIINLWRRLTRRFLTAKRKLAILKEARRLIAAGWCQGPYAQNAKGDATNVLGPNACKFCAKGSIRRAYDEALGFDYSMPALFATLRIEEAVEEHLPKSHLGDLARWNEQEGRTQEEVVAAFDRAIAALQA